LTLYGSLGSAAHEELRFSNKQNHFPTAPHFSHTLVDAPSPPPAPPTLAAPLFICWAKIAAVTANIREHWLSGSPLRARAHTHVAATFANFRRRSNSARHRELGQLRLVGILQRDRRP
jgi:hypothetical protein